MSMENTTAGRIKALADFNIQIGDSATLQNGWRGHVAAIDEAYVLVRIAGKKHLYRCSPLAVDKIRAAKV